MVKEVLPAEVAASASSSGNLTALKRFASSQLWRTVPVLTKNGLAQDLIKESLGEPLKETPPLGCSQLS